MKHGFDSLGEAHKVLDMDFFPTGFCDSVTIINFSRTPPFFRIYLAFPIQSFSSVKFVIFMVLSLCNKQEGTSSGREQRTS